MSIVIFDPLIKHPFGVVKGQRSGQPPGWGEVPAPVIHFSGGLARWWGACPGHTTADIRRGPPIDRGQHAARSETLRPPCRRFATPTALPRSGVGCPVWPLPAVGADSSRDAAGGPSSRRKQGRTLRPRGPSKSLTVSDFVGLLCSACAGVLLFMYDHSTSALGGVIETRCRGPDSPRCRVRFSRWGIKLLPPGPSCPISGPSPWRGGPPDPGGPPSTAGSTASAC